MRATPWLAGLSTAAIVAAAAQTVVALDLAALTGLAWGVVAWTYVAYPEARSQTFDGLAGSDRWIAAMLLLAAAVAFATVRVVAEGETATVLYAQVLGVCIALMALGALLEART